MKHLEGLKQLRWLHLVNNDITDAGLVHLQGLSKLRWLNLDGTKVTAAASMPAKCLAEHAYLALKVA